MLSEPGGCYDKIIYIDYFSKIRPATTMVEVRRLISPEMLVEIEAEALVTESASHPQS